MDGPTFSATFSSVATTTAVRDVFQILAPTNSRLEICECELGQSSDAGDANDELLTFEIIRGSTTSGSGGTAFTPVPHQPWGATSGSSVLTNNTTVSSSGGVAVFPHSTTFNIRAGLLYRPNAGDGKRGSNERLFVEAGTRCTFRMGGPADAVTLSGRLTWKEIGNI